MCKGCWVWRPNPHQIYADMNSRGGVDVDVIENSLAICLVALSLTTVLGLYYYNDIFLSTGAGISPQSVEQETETWCDSFIQKIYAVSGLVLKGLLLLVSVSVHCSFPTESNGKHMDKKRVNSVQVSSLDIKCKLVCLRSCWLSLYKDLLRVPKYTVKVLNGWEVQRSNSALCYSQKILVCAS